MLSKQQVICKVRYAEYEHESVISKRSKPNHCQLATCVEGVNGGPRATREGKPFCTEHLDHMPYYCEVRGRIERHENYIASVNLGGVDAVRLDAELTRWMISELWINEGELNIARFMRVLMIVKKVALAQGLFLDNKKIVTFIPAKRMKGLGNLKLVDSLVECKDMEEVFMRAEELASDRH